MRRWVHDRRGAKAVGLVACQWLLVLSCVWALVDNVSKAMAVDGAVNGGGADTTYTRRIRPILQKYCFECHGEKIAKSRLRLDTLSTEFLEGQAIASWQAVIERVSDQTESGMPPEGKPRPSTGEIKALREWIATKVANAVDADAATHKTEGRAQLRRLNRVEYNNTLHDLLGIDIDLKPLLPDDDVVAGFDNVGTGLQITRIHHERYLEAAETALNAVMTLGKQPKTTQTRLTFRKADYPPRRVVEGDVMAFFTSAAAELQQSRVGALGHYRIRISAYPYQNPGRPMVLHVNCGNPNHPDERYLPIAADTTTVVEFVGRMAAGNTIRTAPYGLGQKYIRDLAAYQGPGMAIEWVEIEGPLIDTWPPENYQRLLGQLDLKKATVEDAERVMRSFIPRAFRRPVNSEKIQKYVDFLRTKIADNNSSVDDALRQAMTAVLCSPDFLMLYEKPGPLDDFALASRLSYFLWRSQPDQPLIDLASQNKLHFKDELRRQVERLLQAPKAATFAEQFLGQWLGLRQIDATTPDKMLYPEFDEYLKYSMLQEPLHFFEEMLKNDLSIKCFIDSTFSMLNDRLAAHYGIPDVVGPEFRKVTLSPDSHRGGVLAMGAVLKVTANGTVTSPVLRGAWVQDKIMGQPLQLPTDLMVPAVEPDIRGALDIRDQLAKHRTVAQCASCHQKMDPYGFALENFDPIGGYRTNYRALGKNPKANVTIYDKPVQYSHGLAVQAGDVLPNGRAFKDCDEFKKILLDDPSPFIRTVTEKLLIYATGSPGRPADRASVDGIIERARGKNYGLRTLVHELVQSDLFLNK